MTIYRITVLFVSIIYGSSCLFCWSSCDSLRWRTSMWLV